MRNERNYMKSILLFFILFFVSTSLFAEDVEVPADYKTGERLSFLDSVRSVEKLTEPIKQHLKDNNIDLDFFAGVIQGFDNNVNLDPERRKDGFLETSLNTEAAYNYTDDIRLEVENYTTDILYYNVNDANLLDFYNRAGLELDLFDDAVVISADYALDYVWFPCDKDGTYYGNYAMVAVKHNISADLYHEVGYKFLYKSYTHDKTLGSNGTRTDDYRSDFRNSMDYEAGLYIADKVMISTNVQFYRNNSNYQYFDYYDYWSFRIRPSLTVNVTDKLYLTGNFSYQRRNYDDRLSSENSEHVHDNTYSFNLSALYELTKSFTLTTGLSYRENVSNEPLQKYSGTIITAGLYYSF